jgi:SAM-dependent methyltransferase
MCDWKNEAYEQQVAPYKKLLFSRLHSLIPQNAAWPTVIVELGIGGFPHASHYTGWGNLELIGIEPDPEKHSLTLSRAGLFGLRLRMYHCVAERLPLANSVDAVVSTCTLCTVDDVPKTFAEVKCVLRAGGVFAFLEHVLSQTEPHQRAVRRLHTEQVVWHRWCRIGRVVWHLWRRIGLCAEGDKEREPDGALVRVQGVAGHCGD